MLVIAAKPGDTISVGNGSVKVIESRPGRIRLGFAFDKSVHICRDDGADDGPTIDECKTESAEAVAAHRRGLIQRNF
jgi:sRNA-binding carbon storage regulator CsrA